MDSAVEADHRVKMNVSEKKNKYLDIARKLKKLCNMKLSILPIVNGALGAVIKGLIQGLNDLEIGGRVKTI